jgi:hypothetical protein
VYGPAQEDKKNNFLQELVNAWNVGTSPVLVGGDFNIIRNPKEKIITGMMIDGHSYLML